MEGRVTVNQEVDAVVVSRDIGVDGDSSKAEEEDGVVTPKPIIGILAQGSVEKALDRSIMMIHCIPLVRSTFYPRFLTSGLHSK